MLRDFLVLRGVKVLRVVETPDGMGEMTSVTTITTLPRAAIWSPSQSANYISDKMAQTSSHVLVTEPSDYTFTAQDDEVIYNGVTYEINGPSDDVMLKGEIMVTGLRLSV